MIYNANDRSGFGKKEQLVSEELLDYLTEVMNVGAGNGATALSQLLDTDVDLKMPELNIISAGAPIPQSSIIVAGVKMKIVGDINGYMFFFVSDTQKQKLINLTKIGLPGGSTKQSNEYDLSVLSEVGNIVAGVYTTAIHDFCKLNLYYSAPVLAIDMVQSIIDEILATMGYVESSIIIVENDFVVGETKLDTSLLLILSAKSVSLLQQTLFDQISYSKLQ